MPGSTPVYRLVMCISTAPAHLSNTIIYAAEVQGPSGDVRHVIGYQNKASNDRHNRGPNAMLLPLPAVGHLGPDNVVNGKDFPDILKAYRAEVEHLKPKPRSFSRSLVAAGAAGGSRSFQVFESGSYTIALAEKPSGLLKALQLVPERKRPEIPVRFALHLGQLYRDWPLAVCCFDGTLENPEPLLWHFTPKFPKVLFAPAIDAHDGNPPDITKMVQRDHSVAFTSYRSTRRTSHKLEAEIAKVPAEHRWLFQGGIVGTQVENPTGNGDFTMPIDAVLDSSVPSYLPKLNVTLPPCEPQSRYDWLMGDASV